MDDYKRFNDIGLDVIQQLQGEFDQELLDTYIYITENADIAKDSVCQFKEMDWDGGKRHGLTLLGFINGILPELTGKVLVKKLDDEAGKTVGWDILDKWW